MVSDKRIFMGISHRVLQIYVWHFKPPTKMAATAELNLTKDPMENSHKNLLV
jgi:hypothetical protein